MFGFKRKSNNQLDIRSQLFIETSSIINHLIVINDRDLNQLTIGTKVYTNHGYSIDVQYCNKHLVVNIMNKGGMSVRLTGLEVDSRQMTTITNNASELKSIDEVKEHLNTTISRYMELLSADK